MPAGIYNLGGSVILNGSAQVDDNVRGSPGLVQPRALNQALQTEGAVMSS